MKINSLALEKTSISELREKISFVEATKSRDDEGRELNSWDKDSPKSIVWAKVDAYSSNFISAQDMNRYNILYQILIRYKATTINLTDHIFWKGLELEIISPPINIGARNNFLVIDCREWK